MDEAEKMGAALVTSGVSRDRVVSYIFAQLCRIASDEARRRDDAWLEILLQVHKPHPQPEICMACVSILQHEPRSASDPAEPEKAMSRLKEALAREGEIVEAQPETPPRDWLELAATEIVDKLMYRTPSGRMTDIADVEAIILRHRPGPTKEARPEPPEPECLYLQQGDRAYCVTHSKYQSQHKPPAPAPEARVSPEPPTHDPGDVC